MRFGFLVTARCNAACSHCTTSCGPHATTALSRPKILALMDEAAALWRKHHVDGEELQFSISGGEPFLDFPLLLDIVAHGARLGAWVGCVTNGSWATSDLRAREKLGKLKAAGLRALAVSTSRFHREYVATTRVELALRIAGELGLHTTLKCATVKSDGASLRNWARSAGAKALEVFPVVPYLREGARLPEREYIRRRALPRGRCPAPTITIREDGTAYTCCMPGGFVDFLALGSVHDVPLERVYDRFYLQGKQQALRHKGPIHFARAVIAAGEGHRLRASYESACDLCAHVASDPTMAAVAERAAEKVADSQYRAAERRLVRQSRQSKGVSHEEEKAVVAP
jgi:pyruvate-formate lyase-activating enzyme